MTKSSKFMPAGACAVVVCIVGTSNAYVDVSSAALIHTTTHTPAAPFHPQVKQVQKGQPHYSTRFVRVCVCVSESVCCNLAKCRRSRTDEQSLFAFSRYFTSKRNTFICMRMYEYVSLYSQVVLPIYTNWYTLISDAPHTTPVAIAQQ